MNTMQTFVMLGGGFYLAINISFILWWNLLGATRSKESVRIPQREYSPQNFRMIEHSHR